MIILDTHVLIWWLGEPEKLSRKAKKAIEIAVSKSVVVISSISIWELYLLVKKDRLKLTMDTDTWVAKVEELPFVQFIPVDNRIAARSVLLNEKVHEDPADRIIIATALHIGAPLVTSDRRILSYRKMPTIW